MAKIGFIGLGNMGLPMAQNLVKAGHAVSGFDVNEASAGRLAESGGTRVASAAEACRTISCKRPRCLSWSSRRTPLMPISRDSLRFSRVIAIQAPGRPQTLRA